MIFNNVKCLVKFFAKSFSFATDNRSFQIVFFWNKKTIEEGNIEYGNIENCNIDTNLTSKIWRLVTSKKSDGNMEFIINLFNINSKNGVKRGQMGY